MMNNNHKHLKISEKLVEKAIKYGQDCLPYEFDRFGLDDNQRLEKIVVGTIGELIFYEYIKSSELIDKVEFNLLVGQYDDFDFRIAGKKIDVKTSGFEGSFRRLNLLYAVEPYGRRNYDFVIKIFIDGYIFSKKSYDYAKINNAFIVGFIPYENIKDFPTVNFGYADDYKVPVESLIPITELKNYIE